MISVNDKMKKSIFLMIFLVSTFGSLEAQNLDSLRKAKVRMTNCVSLINDSIKNIDAQITVLETKLVIKKYKESTLKVVCRKEAKLRNNPDPLSSISATLPAGSIVTIIDYLDGYLGVCSDTLCGYLNDIWINPTEESNRFIAIKKEEIEHFKKAIANKQAIENAEQEKSYIKKYGVAVYNKLKQGKFWIGMDENMAIISLNFPDKINRTVTRYGVHEQWVYSDKYLYFENGILTAYQD